MENCGKCKGSYEAGSDHTCALTADQSRVFVRNLIDGLNEIDVRWLLRRLMTHGGGLQNLLTELAKDLRDNVKPQDEFYTLPMAKKIEEALAIYKARYDGEK